MIVKIPHAHLSGNQFIYLDISKPYKIGKCDECNELAQCNANKIFQDGLSDSFFDISISEVERLIENAKFEMKFKQSVE